MDTKTLFKNVLTKGAHIEVNTRLVKKLGIKEAIVLYELYGQQKNFYGEDGSESRLKDGFFYATNDFLTTSTLLSEHQIRDAVKTLEETWVYMDNKSGDEYTEIITQLENDIQDVLKNKKLTDEQKRKKIHTLKRQAGFENLVETNFTYSYGEKIKWYRVHSKTVDKFIIHDDGSVSMNAIGPDAFVIYNKPLAYRTNPAAAVVFSDLLTTYYITEMYDNLEDGEWFKYVITTQAKRLGIDRKTLARKYISQLVDVNLINKKTMGSKNNTYISINWDTLFEMLAGCKVETVEGKVVITQEENEIERITKRLLERVKEISDLDWGFNFSRGAFIEQRLDEGITEEDLYNVIEYKYNDYKRISGGKYFDRRFNWTNLFGSNCKTWIDNMHNQKVKDENNLKLEALSLRIIEEVKKVAHIEWRLDETYYPLLQRQLDCGVSEDELVALIKHQYDWKLSHEGKIKNFTWNKIYGEFQTDDGKGYSCYATIQAMRRLKTKGTYNPETKKFKMTTNNGSRDNVNTNGDMRGKIKQSNITGKRGKDYF